MRCGWMCYMYNYGMCVIAHRPVKELRRCPMNEAARHIKQPERR